MGEKPREAVPRSSSALELALIHLDLLPSPFFLLPFGPFLLTDRTGQDFKNHYGTCRRLSDELLEEGEAMGREDGRVCS